MQKEPPISGWVWMSVKPGHHVGSIIILLHHISSVSDAILISLLHQKAQKYYWKEPQYEVWTLLVLVTWPHQKKTPTGWWLTTSSLSGTSNSKDLAQIMWWNMLTAFSNGNYEVLSMWLDYKATIVGPHLEMNSRIPIWRPHLYFWVTLLHHLNSLCNSQTSP